MTVRYLPDTDILITIMKHCPPIVPTKFTLNHPLKIDRSCLCQKEKPKF
ncbi:MAG: hypothetical protein RL748_2132 [Pseudomonadota bacterium]